MAFVGQTADPWEVPVKHSVAVLQKIWDATNANEYKITALSSIHQKVNEDMTAIKKAVSLMSREDEIVRVILESDRGATCNLLPIMNEMIVREDKLSQSHESKESGEEER
jgi:hypothetical protein